MFTKLALNYLRRQVEDLDDRREKQGCKNYLNIIEHLLQKNEVKQLRVIKDDKKIIVLN